MAMLLAWILASVVLVSLLSLVGAVLLGLKKQLLDQLTFFLVAFSAGALLGGAFIHLLPEAVLDAAKGPAPEAGVSSVFIYAISGIIFFFLIEKVLRWRHCHKGGKCDFHAVAYMNLYGDAVHNFIDGTAIAAAYLAGIPVGIATTIAVVLHEIPQEMGDFGVLIYGGFSRRKALFYNFITALTAVLGALATFFLSSQVQGLTIFLLPFTAGGFIYIACTDLFPELHKGSRGWSMAQFAIVAFGIVLMWGMKMLVPEAS